MLNWGAGNDLAESYPILSGGNIRGNGVTSYLVLPSGWGTAWYIISGSGIAGPNVNIEACFLEWCVLSF